MILNYDLLCEVCKKLTVCDWRKKIDAFDEEKKNPIGVTIELQDCEEFDKAGIEKA